MSLIKLCPLLGFNSCKGDICIFYSDGDKYCAIPLSIELHSATINRLDEIKNSLNDIQITLKRIPSAK